MHLNAGDGLKVLVENSANDGSALNKLETYAIQRLTRLQRYRNTGACPTALAIFLRKKSVAIDADSIGTGSHVGECEGPVVTRCHAARTPAASSVVPAAVTFALKS